MKKIFIYSLLFVTAIPSFAQQKEEDQKGKFRRDNIFIGGGIGLGIGGWSGGFNIGANPEIGYSVANWLDAGISTNINYYSFRAEVNNGVRQRSINYGGGVFLRAYPIESFFIQVLPEYNWIHTSLFNTYNNQTTTINQNAASLLAGVGYGRRIVGQTNFYTVLMIDLGTELNSPYRDSYGAAIPVIRTGFNFYLRPKKQR